MLKAGKIGAALVMGLMLSLALLASGAFAQNTTTAQNSASATTRTATFTVNVQQGTEQMLPTSNTQVLKEGASSARCGWGYCRTTHVRHYRRYWNSSRIRCRWFRRGWGRWRRTVRVCR
ncbi:MAG TPA: hypothetical protein VN729_04500, partial [Ktedonobacteraceae bacterium]|nr:hypothetical protein [Ktedonobacteraceae bacterium]